MKREPWTNDEAIEFIRSIYTGREVTISGGESPKKTTLSCQGDHPEDL